MNKVTKRIVDGVTIRRWVGGGTSGQNIPRTGKQIIEVDFADAEQRIIEYVKETGGISALRTYQRAAYSLFGDKARVPIFTGTTNKIIPHYPQSSIYWIERLENIPRMFLGRFFCCGANDLPQYLGSIEREEHKFKIINVN